MEKLITRSKTLPTAARTRFQRARLLGVMSTEVMQNIKILLTRILFLGCSLLWLPVYGDSINETSPSEKTAIDIKEVLEWVVLLDPEIDVYESITKKDFRFIGYYPNHMTNLPFIPRDRICRTMIWKVNSDAPRIVGGPSFQDRKEPNLELINRFDNYLIKYNSIMQNYLIETEKIECDS